MFPNRDGVMSLSLSLTNILIYLHDPSHVSSSNLGSCQQLRLGEGRRGWNREAWNVLGILGGCKNVQVHREERKNVLSYTISNMHVNTMAQLRYWGVSQKGSTHLRVGHENCLCIQGGMWSKNFTIWIALKFLLMFVGKHMSSLAQSSSCVEPLLEVTWLEYGIWDVFIWPK